MYFLCRLAFAAFFAQEIIVKDHITTFVYDISCRWLAHLKVRYHLLKLGFRSFRSGTLATELDPISNFNNTARPSVKKSLVKKMFWKWHGKWEIICTFLTAFQAH